MLTKTLAFDPEALKVLQEMIWSDDGTIGYIRQTLDRKIYEKVAKALEAMGGKWNRSAGGFIFPQDPRPSVEGLLEDVTIKVEKDGFFETPRAVVLRMLDIVPLDQDPKAFYLEPEAGHGAILRVLLEKGVDPLAILAIEKNEGRAKYIKAQKLAKVVGNFDFLELDPETDFKDLTYSRIYMNPPFEEGQDIDHVRHAYKFLAPGGTLITVMSEGVFFRGDRKAAEFRDWLFENDAANERLPEGSFKSSGTGVSTRLVWITKPR